MHAIICRTFSTDAYLFVSIQVSILFYLSSIKEMFTYAAIGLVKGLVGAVNPGEVIASYMHTCMRAYIMLASMKYFIVFFGMIHTCI